MWGFPPCSEPPSDVLARPARPPRSQSPRSWLSVRAFARSSLLFRFLVSPSVFAPSPRHPPSFGCRAKSSSASADLPRPRPLSPRFNYQVYLCVCPSFVGRFGASVLPPLGWFFCGSVRLCPLRSGCRGAPSRGWPFGRNPLLGRSASPYRFALCRAGVRLVDLRGSRSFRLAQARNSSRVPRVALFASLRAGTWSRRSFSVATSLFLRSRSAPLKFCWDSSAGAVRSWWLGSRPDPGERAPGIWKSRFFFLLLPNNLKIYCLCMYLSRFSNSFSAGFGCCWRWSLCCYSSGFGSVKAQ